MTDLLLAPGEMRLTDFSVLELRDVKELGAMMLGDVVDMKAKHEFMLEELFKVDLYDSRYDSDKDTYLEEIHDFYRGLLSNSGIEFPRVRTWVMHGQNENISWHIDRAGDVRFLLNVGEPTSVEIAEEWDPELYTPGDTGYPAPTKATSMELDTGSLYACNGLVTDQKLLKPHQTPEQLNRITLRTCFYAAEGWKDQAVDGGVTVTLVSAL